MRYMLALLFSVLALTALASESGSTGSKDLNVNFTVSWTVTEDKETISFTLCHAVLGWMAIGFNTAPQMAGADIYSADYDGANL